MSQDSLDEDTGSAPEADVAEPVSAPSSDEMVGTMALQDNDSDTIKHSQDGHLQERDG